MPLVWASSWQPRPFEECSGSRCQIGSFWGTATLDIGAKWADFAKQVGVSPEFTDNGNDLGPVIARLAAGNANELFDIGGFQGGAEKELARRGAIFRGMSAKSPITTAFGNGRATFHTSSMMASNTAFQPLSTADSIIYRGRQVGQGG